jgi:hypothetical protein
VLRESLLTKDVGSRRRLGAKTTGSGRDRWAPIGGVHRCLTSGRGAAFDGVIFDFVDLGEPFGSKARQRPSRSPINWNSGRCDMACH